MPLKYSTILMVLVISTPAVAKDLLFVGQDYPPFNWSEGGEAKGAMVEVVKRTCEKLKHNYLFTIVPLARAVKMLEDGEVTGVLSLIPSAERASLENFSPTIIVTNLTYFATKDNAKKVGSLKEIDGWTVGVVRGSTSLRVAMENQKQAKDMVINEEVSTEIMIKKLQGGRYGDKGVIFGGDAILEYEAKQNKVLIEPVLIGDAQGFTTAFSKKSVDAQTFTDFTNAIEGMKKSNELKDILSKFGLKTN